MSTMIGAEQDPLAVIRDPPDGAIGVYNKGGRVRDSVFLAEIEPRYVVLSDGTGDGVTRLKI